MKITKLTEKEAQNLTSKNLSKTSNKLHCNAENQQNNGEKRKRGRPKKVETVVEEKPIENAIFRHPVAVYTRQQIARVEKQTGLIHSGDEVDDSWNYKVPIFNKVK